MNNRSKFKSPWLWLSLCLLIATISGLSVLGVRMSSVRRQHQAVARIRDLGGSADSYNSGFNPRRLSELFIYPQVRNVWLKQAKVTDADLRQLAALTSIERLDLTDTPIRSDDVRLLTPLQNLQSLTLSQTGIGDDGVRHLKSLPRIKTLSLANTAIGNVGLSRLIGLTQLQSLDISGCPIAGDGLAALRSFALLRALELDDRQVTSASVQHLQGLPLNRITVRIQRGSGKQQRDLLASPGIADAAGLTYADRSTLWSTSQPWDESLAGLCEMVQRQVKLDASQADEFLRIVAESEPPSGLPFVPQSSPTVSTLKADPTAIQSYADFIAAIEGEVNSYDANLWAFVRSEQAKLIIPNLVQRLQDPNLKDPGRRLRTLSAYILVRFGLHDENVVKLLAQMLHDDPDKSVRTSTVFAFQDFFGKYRSDVATRTPNADESRIALELLLPATSDEDNDTRAEAALVLGHIVHRYPEHAAKVLPAIVGQLVDSDVSFWRFRSRSAWDQVARVDPSALQPHLASLRRTIDTTGDVETTATLIEALGSVGKVSEEDANAAADLFLAILLQPDRLRNKSEFTVREDGRWVRSGGQRRIKSATITAIGRLAEDDAEATRSIISQLLEEYAANQDLRPTVEQVFWQMVSGVHRRRKN